MSNILPIQKLSSINQNQTITPVQKNKLLMSPEKLKKALQLKKSSQEFESIFLQYLLGTMKDSVDKSDFYGEDKSTQGIVDGMYNEALSNEMSKAGGIGLANLLYKQLVKSI